MKLLGAILLKLRSQKKMSQHYIAEQVGVS